jgi:hypothetical protein
MQTSGSIEKLLSIASEPILPKQDIGVSLLSANPASQLFKMLRAKNGFYAFESALHVFPLGSAPGVMDLETWNSSTLWRHSFGDMVEGFFFFAEDAFGVQFGIKENKVCTFDPDSGLAKGIGESIEDWAKLVLEDYPLLTGYPLAHEWQAIHGLLPAGKRLYPKTPFVFGGEFKVENLYAGEPVERMNFYGSVAMQMKGLPDGSKVRLKVVP